MNTDKMLPLEGIKVVELATVVAAPTAGRMLCAYGAEVIKVENLIGDDLRRAGEFERVVCEDYKNPIFTIQNSGKKLVALNLKSEEGKRAMLKLLEDGPEYAAFLLLTDNAASLLETVRSRCLLFQTVPPEEETEISILPPSGVNLTALPMRFVHICCIRSSLP